MEIQNSNFRNTGLYKYLTEFVCSRAKTISERLIFANCLFSDDSLSLSEVSVRSIGLITDPKKKALVNYSFNEVILSYLIKKK